MVKKILILHYSADCGHKFEIEKSNESIKVVNKEPKSNFGNIPLNNNIPTQQIQNDNLHLMNVAMNKKSEGLACLLSFFIPGLGHAYIKKYGRFILIFILAIILIINILYASYRYNFLGNLSLYNLYYLGYDMADYESAGAWLNFSMILYLIFWFVQLILTYFDAKKYNENLLRGIFVGESNAGLILLIFILSIFSLSAIAGFIIMVT